MTLRKVSRLACIVFVLPVLGCGFYDAFMRTRQVRSFIYLQEICFDIEAARKGTSGYISEHEAYSIVNSIHGGRDSWGNKIIFLPNGRRELFKYVVISPGSDGKLEKTVPEYFSMKTVNIRGSWAADIVFQDGEAVTLAGK